MCGIAAVINGDWQDLSKMGKTINRRGLTSNSYEVGNLKVFHSLLPITDPEAPPQPYQAGPYIVWLNGYISNYKELALKYRINLKTDCDTELLAELFAIHGMGCVNELNGFFAIIVFNAVSGITHTVTDRYGIKQLYLYRQGETTYIASEVKALLSVCDIEISEEAAVDWLYSLGVMNPNTIYKGIDRAMSVPFNKTPKQISISYSDAKQHLLYLLNESINRNRVEGMKTGVFLSGGIDSGIIAKRMTPDFSFSMDYLDDSYSEIDRIKKNSRGIHHTLICNDRLVQEYKHATIDALDDLKAGSCYTNFALTELASKFCRVIYSGAGGDEVFDGYVHRYNRPINEVIRRIKITDDLAGVPLYEDITHKEYDWKFLRAILVVEDRMAGHHTMETRYPLLDNDFVDFALSLPPEYRTGKRILKDISGLHDDVKSGPKHGFSNPHFDNFQWAKFALKETRNRIS